MEQCCEKIVLYLIQNIILFVFAIILINSDVFSQEIETNIQIVEKLTTNIINEVPIVPGTRITVITNDSSQTGMFIKNSIIKKLMIDKYSVIESETESTDSLLSFILLKLNISYFEKRNRFLSVKNQYVRKIDMCLNVNLSYKGHVILNRDYSKAYSGLFDLASLKSIEQNGRILGRGIFIKQKQSLSWIEPVISLIVITIIGSLFYFVRSK